MGSKKKLDNQKATKAIIGAFLGIILLSALGFYLANRHVFLGNLKLKEQLLVDVEKQANTLYDKIYEAGSTAEQLAKVIAAAPGYDEARLDQEMNSRIERLPMLFGGGVWLEPNAYKTGVKHHAIYYYRDEKNKLQKMNSYSDGSFDYFSFDWYKEALDTGKSLRYTEPYRDMVINTTFINCTSPIVKDGKAIGVATSDISMSIVKLSLATTHVGDKGYAFILTKDGFYIANELRGKHDLEDVISEDENSEIRELGERILEATKPGVVTLNSTNEYAAYAPIGDTGLFLVMINPQK